MRLCVHEVLHRVVLPRVRVPGAGEHWRTPELGTRVHDSFSPQCVHDESPVGTPVLGTRSTRSSHRDGPVGRTRCPPVRPLGLTTVGIRWHRGDRDGETGGQTSVCVGSGPPRSRSVLTPPCPTSGGTRIFLCEARTPSRGGIVVGPSPGVSPRYPWAPGEVGARYVTALSCPRSPGWTQSRRG